ncbi:alpha,alpha-trehalase TreF [Alteromonas sediminis]|uniref:Alpha,alpha-trehalase TreF n=1 Tax=Alteromonas sediminis TaxID=2259342 RepID=A0A3N5Y3A1_9ALTE|nr:alpha,alpha-trehalase TreF [Alteromonas sediminis]RPJ68352.1 alpha,alpha-trehalase TreF [Alteromonas sediminis]
MTENHQNVQSQAQQFFNSTLFHDVQMARVFPDSKTFADASPKSSITHILLAYENEKSKEGFSLNTFVENHFSMPDASYTESKYIKTGNLELTDYIECLWSSLTRQPSEQANETSLLALPHPYIIPGGRFREIYYWDSFFTALGLVDSEQMQLVVNMVDNFFYLQQTVHSIPNGNRTYYIGRSQPPVLALLVELILSTPTLLRGNDRNNFIERSIVGLRNEYDFWMQGHDSLSPEKNATKRTVRLADGTVLNRYWDENDTPRPESYFEDVEHANNVKDKAAFWRNLRAACESGWDFSSRWLESANSLTSINTTSLLPVDLNCLLYLLETKLAELYKETNNAGEMVKFKQAAKSRKTAILSVFWNDESGTFYDYNFVKQRHTDVLSAACFLPLYASLATHEQAARTVAKAKLSLIGQCGVHTTNMQSEQQWDHANGWAPLQWFAFEGLSNYGFVDDANHVASSWCGMVEDFYKRHRCLMEKYNLNNPLQFAYGGEYDVQHGFGWTNGVTMALRKKRRKA